jgi:chromosome partitioning protein
VGVKTVALISQKGGSGKTTISLNLAITATLKGKSAVVIDLDPQQSAARWARLRTADAPVILSGHGPNLADLVARARSGGADLVIIDTAPKSENAALAAARLADLVLIPCQPSSLDLDAIADTVNIASLAGRPATFVLNNCRASSHLADQAEEALGAYRIPIAPIRIGNRVAFVKSLSEGKGVLEFEPSGPAARELEHLYMSVMKQVGL